MESSTTSIEYATKPLGIISRRRWIGVAAIWLASIALLFDVVFAVRYGKLTFEIQTQIQAVPAQIAQSRAMQAAAIVAENQRTAQELAKYQADLAAFDAANTFPALTPDQIDHVLKCCESGRRGSLNSEQRQAVRVALATPGQFLIDPRMEVGLISDRPTPRRMLSFYFMPDGSATIELITQGVPIFHNAKFAITPDGQGRPELRGGQREFFVSVIAQLQSRKPRTASAIMLTISTQGLESLRDQFATAAATFVANGLAALFLIFAGRQLILRRPHWKAYLIAHALAQIPLAALAAHWLWQLLDTVVSPLGQALVVLAIVLQLCIVIFCGVLFCEVSRAVNILKEVSGHS